MNPPTVIEAAIAILYQEGRFLLQLRDNIPTIVYPNQWACFGGHMEPGEQPLAAMHRELIEEIGYVISDAVLFKRDESPGVIRYVFGCPLTVDVSTLVLNEGFDMALVTPTDIFNGSCISPRDSQSRPIAGPHQQVLIDFCQREGLEPCCVPAAD